jgi:hypothetical protein
MIKIYIAPFYQVRNLEPNMLPMSTAAGEPEWFHDGKGRDYIFLDKRKVLNGLLAEPFLVNAENNEKFKNSSEMCQKNCPYLTKAPNCFFMRTYAEQLEKLDFNKVITYFENIGETYRNKLKFKDNPIIILLVYEQPSVPCAERVVIRNWFKKYNYELEEWSPDLIYKTELF